MRAFKASLKESFVFPRQHGWRFGSILRLTLKNTSLLDITGIIAVLVHVLHPFKRTHDCTHLHTYARANGSCNAYKYIYARTGMPWLHM